MNIPIAKKSLGQHWLKDESTLRAMVSSAEVNSADTVLEIGPGYGTLTRHLLTTGAQIIALEYDASLVPGLLAEFGNGSHRLKIEQGDVRQFDLTSLPPDYKIVANIPYYLTSNLIQLISETPNQPAIATLLMQKEVAERVVAGPGSMSLLSVTAQFYWEASLGQHVPAALFTPPPKVDSQILILRRRSAPLLPDVEAKKFFRLVKAGYSQKRKTLGNSLSGGLGISRDEAVIALQQAAIDPGRRAQTMSIVEWHQLWRALYEH